MKKLSTSLILASAVTASPAFATDVPFCTSVVPEECLDTTLRVRLQSGTNWTDRITGTAGGTTVTAEVVADVRERSIDGWSYGVTHDPNLLTLDTVATTGAPAEVTNADFEITRAGVSANGFFQAVVLAFTTPVELGRGVARRLVSMTYTTVQSFAGPAEIAFETEAVRPAATSPLVQIDIVQDGASRQCRKMQTAIVD